MKVKFLFVVLLLSLGTNLVFAYLIRQAKTSDGSVGPRVGQLVATLTGTDDSGKPASIPEKDPAERSMVLYVFSKTCAWCEKTNPVLRELLAAKRESFRFVAADLSPAFSASGPYLVQNNLTFESTIHPDPQTRHRLGLRGTPDTLVIDPKGRIVKVFHGAYIGSTLQSVNEFFGTNLREDVNPIVPSNSAMVCGQDGLLFSTGARICWDGKTFECASDKKWKENELGCDTRLYLAKTHPGL
jgi:thiol-disulfide isomerase/thioredoxin